MLTRSPFALLTASLALALGADAARAQPTPKFEYGKAEEAKGVEWSALAKAGLIMTTGNSSTVSASMGASAARKEAGNKFQGEAGLAYVRSNILIVTDDGDGMVEDGEFERDSITTTQAWFLKARYDRFFTEHNSGYGSASVSADEPAGKELIAGGQVGYSRQLYTVEKKEEKEPGKEVVVQSHEVIAEVGYDFSYENYVAPGDAVSIHSARLFAGYTVKISEKTGAYANLELLLNLNKENAPGGDIDPFGDTRLIGKAGLSAQLLEDITFGVGFTAKYDQAPAPLPPFPGLPFAATFTPLADKLDTITEASLIINFV